MIKNSETYDAAIIGLGAMGSASFATIAQEGLKVIGIEQSHDTIHEYCSSQGETRLTRLAYFEHSDYVPLLKYSQDQWSNLEQASGKSLFHQVGLTIYAPKNSSLSEGVLRSARDYNIPTSSTTENPHPQILQNISLPAINEPSAGFLMCEEIIKSYQELGMSSGGTISRGSKVLNLQKKDNIWLVETENNSFPASKVVLTTGAFFPQIAQTLPLPTNRDLNLRVERVPLFWFPISDHQRWQSTTCFAIELPEGFFYSFPSIDCQTIKVAFHRPAGRLSSPLEKTEHILEEEVEEIERLAAKHLLGITPKVTKSQVCLYTMSPDEHFIVDKWPGSENLFYATGFSGHGFKFCPAIGRVMSDWVMGKESSLPINFLRKNRSLEPFLKMPPNLPKGSRESAGEQSPA